MYGGQFIIHAICDHQGIFLAYEFGWPGCISDATVFKESDLWLQREHYFSESEYILVDKGKVLILCHGLSLISNV